MNIEQIKEFILAGNATFTLESQKTGKHLTFRVRKTPDSNRDAWWVQSLTGSDNENSFTYMGMIFTPFHYRLTKNSPKGHSHHDILVWFFNNLNKNKLHPSLTFRHAGKCGKCGRKLTTPESIDSGMGPVCGGRS